MTTAGIHQRVARWALVVTVGGFAGTVCSTTWADGRGLALPTVAPPLAEAAEEDVGAIEAGLGLEVGATVPDFTIATHEGEPITFEALLQRAPLLVVFYRGGWCPYCNTQIRQLTEAYPQFEQRNVLPVLISVDETDGAALAQRTYTIPFPVLSDPDLKAHEAFNVILDIDEATYEQYKRFGIVLEEWSERDHNKIAVASAFIVDEDGIVQWAHATADYTTRPSPEQLLKVVADVID